MANLLGLIDHICLRPDMKDRLHWTPTKEGMFSAKSWMEAIWAGDRLDPTWTMLKISSKVALFSLSLLISS